MTKKESQQKTKNEILFTILNWIPVIILIIVVIWAKLSGIYIENEVTVIEMCKDEILNITINGQQQNITSFY